MRDAASMGMRAPWLLLALALAGCVVEEDDCSNATQLAEDRLVGPSNGQFFLITDAAEKNCHALFEVVLSYAGDDAFDPNLPRPNIDVSANAVGTGGEQPGLLGILLDWRDFQDPETGELGWGAELSAGAKNVPAPAVNYGLAAVLLPGETHDTFVSLSITYVPATSGSERLVPTSTRHCGR